MLSAGIIFALNRLFYFIVGAFAGKGSGEVTT